MARQQQIVTMSATDKPGKVYTMTSVIQVRLRRQRIDRSSRRGRHSSSPEFRDLPRTPSHNTKSRTSASSPGPNPPQPRAATSATTHTRSYGHSLAGCPEPRIREETAEPAPPAARPDQPPTTERHPRPLRLRPTAAAVRPPRHDPLHRPDPRSPPTSSCAQSTPTPATDRPDTPACRPVVRSTGWRRYRQGRTH
jgi:hypothetical protein